jgi:hypothetical protein
MPHRQTRAELAHEVETLTSALLGQTEVESMADDLAAQLQETVADFRRAVLAAGVSQLLLDVRCTLGELEAFREGGWDRYPAQFEGFRPLLDRIDAILGTNDGLDQANSNGARPVGAAIPAVGTDAPATAAS